MASNDYLKRMQQMKIYDLREYGFIARMQTLDIVTIALGQMGMDPDFLANFEDEYCIVQHEYCKEVSDDGAVDRKMVYSREEIDRAIKQYVREDRFAPYEKRYAVPEENRLRRLCFGVDFKLNNKEELLDDR